MQIPSTMNLLPRSERSEQSHQSIMGKYSGKRISFVSFLCLFVTILSQNFWAAKSKMAQSY